MARKVEKAKATTVKPSTSVKKRSARTKKENLSNGLGTNENEKAENVETKTAENAQMEATENETNDLSEAVDSTQGTENTNVIENTTDSAKSDEHMEEENVTSEVVKTAPRPQKRKAAAEDKKAVAKIKSKKQKVVLEIPKISSITGKVFVLGDNGVGQLGLGEDIPEKTRPALLDLPYSFVDIASGGMHSVCLTESGEVITFGCNDEGALGRITSEEGSEHIPQKVDIPERIVQVSAGDSHSAALSESGQVYIWGNFRNGDGPMGLITDGMKQATPVKILNNVTVIKIASGSDHLVCLSQEGVVYTCGCGQQGQLGRVSEHSSADGGRRGITLLLTPDKVPVTKSHKCTVNNVWTGSYSTFVNIQDSGSVYVFGLNNHNQLGVENVENQTNILKPKEASSFNNKTWLQIEGGQHHTLALDNNGLVYSLGRSEYGRLGLGENCNSKSVPTAVSSLNDKKCIDISCGDSVSFAITNNGSVYSWGFGENHQLGHGDDNDQHLPQLIEGSFFNSWKALKIAGGGQHTLILAQPRKSLEKSQ